jgi:hypothetical protein
MGVTGACGRHLRVERQVEVGVYPGCRSIVLKMGELREDDFGSGVE